MEAFLRIFYVIYNTFFCIHCLLSWGTSKSSLNELKIPFETYPNENHSISVPFERRGRMDTILRRRGEEEKRWSGVKRGLKVMRMWPLRLRFFEVFLIDFSVLPLARALSANHVSGKKGKERKGGGGRDSPLSPANFKHL